MSGSAFGSMAQQLGGGASPRCKVGRLQRLQMLRELEQAQAQGVPVPSDVLQWIAGAARKLLEQGGRLDEHLGIARRWGKHQSPNKLLALQERDAAIAAIFAMAPGTGPGHKNEATVRIIHGLNVTTPGPEAEALETLRRVGGQVGLPASGRQIARIVHAQAIKRSRP